MLLPGVPRSAVLAGVGNALARLSAPVRQPVRTWLFRLPLAAPFATRSFRYQWPADSSVAWALEMETLILGWYMLIETGSVAMLTVFASLQYIGTLAAPMLGMWGDRLGLRQVLATLRFAYAALAGMLLLLAATGHLTPAAVLVLAGLSGLIRPSDIGLRTALVGATVPPQHLMSAMGLARTSMDSAKVAGALAGTAVVAAHGMAAAYTVITAIHLFGAWLTLRVDAGRQPVASATAAAPSPWTDLREGLATVRRTPLLLAAMAVAALVNLSAFPFTGGLMPYVAREVYGLDARGLGWLIAAYASGALMGSLAMGALGGRFGAARSMLVAALLWYGCLAAFAASQTLALALFWLVAAGMLQSTSMLALQMLLLRGAAPRLRGRIMGVRMLAIYPLPLGLLLAGQMIPRLGFGATAGLMLGAGVLLLGVIGWRWRHTLLPKDAPGNARPAA